jgi:hypothetical protein
MGVGVTDPLTIILVPPWLFILIKVNPPLPLIFNNVNAIIDL